MLLQTICFHGKERGESNLLGLTILRTVYQLEMLFHALILHKLHPPPPYIFSTKALRFMITSQLGNSLWPHAGTPLPFSFPCRELVSGPLQVQRQGCQGNVIKVDAGWEKLNRGWGGVEGGGGGVRGVTFFDFLPLQSFHRAAVNLFYLF